MMITLRRVTHSHHADCKQGQAQKQIVTRGDRYHQILRLAITTAPIMATNSKIEAISNGST